MAACPCHQPTSSTACCGHRGTSFHSSHHAYRRSSLMPGAAAPASSLPWRRRTAARDATPATVPEPPPPPLLQPHCRRLPPRMDCTDDGRTTSRAGHGGLRTAREHHIRAAVVRPATTASPDRARMGPRGRRQVRAPTPSRPQPKTTAPPEESLRHHHDAGTPPRPRASTSWPPPPQLLQQPSSRLCNPYPPDYLWQLGPPPRQGPAAAAARKAGDGRVVGGARVAPGVALGCDTGSRLCVGPPTLLQASSRRSATR